MELYFLDKKKLMYKKVKKRFFIFTSLSVAVIIFISFLTGTLVGGVTVSIKNKNDKISLQLFQNEIKRTAWEDSVFMDYKIKADIWLSRPIFQGTPLKGEMMALAARNAYDSTGVLLPVELALTQAQLESGMGREGRSPKNNPYNVGENDHGTVRWFDNTFDGVQAYYYLMCNNYLKCRGVDELFSSFVNCEGKRYASSETYETKIRNQYYLIKKWLSKDVEN